MGRRASRKGGEAESKEVHSRRRLQCLRGQSPSAVRRTATEERSYSCESLIEIDQACKYIMELLRSEKRVTNMDEEKTEMNLWCRTGIKCNCVKSWRQKK